VKPRDLQQRILACVSMSLDDVILAGISNDDLTEIQNFNLRENCSMLTIMFDDIVGSVALCHKLGEPVYQRLRKEHDNTVKEILNAHGKGEVIKSTGDGLLIVFTAPSDAVKCALNIQKTFQGHKWLKLRIGIDVGQVQETEEPSLRDVFGLPVATACRIMGLADGGHILTSKVIYEEAKRWVLSEQASWTSLGSRRCKPGEPILDVYEVYTPNLTLPMEKLPNKQEMARPPSLVPYIEIYGQVSIGM
jgi:class 3 adenylate cyclase